MTVISSLTYLNRGQVLAEEARYTRLGTMNTQGRLPQVVAKVSMPEVHHRFNIRDDEKTKRYVISYNVDKTRTQKLFSYAKKDKAEAYADAVAFRAELIRQF